MWNGGAAWECEGQQHGEARGIQRVRGTEGKHHKGAGAGWARVAATRGSMEKAVSEGQQHGEARSRQRVRVFEGWHHGKAGSRQGERCSIMGMAGAGRETGAAAWRSVEQSVSEGQQHVEAWSSQRVRGSEV